LLHERLVGIERHHHPEQRIAHFVSDSGHQLAERRELLAALYGFLQRNDPRDVAKNQDQPFFPLGFAEIAGDVPVAGVIIDRASRAGVACIENRVDEVIERAPELAIAKARDVAAEDGGVRSSGEIARGAIHPDDDAFARREKDRKLDRVERESPLDSLPLDRLQQARAVVGIAAVEQWALRQFVVLEHGCEGASKERADGRNGTNGTYGTYGRNEGLMPRNTA